MTKKILWVADFDDKEQVGGAQVSDRMIINYGKSVGLDITEFNFRSPEGILSENFDTLVASNITLLYLKRRPVFDFVLNHPKYVYLQHDSNRFFSKSDRENIYLKCKKAIFLTEYHYKLFEKWYGNIFQNVVIVPDPVDVSKFYNFDQERENKTLFAGYYGNDKGAYYFVDYALGHTSDKFVVAGWGDKVYDHCFRTIPNIELLGKIEQSLMPTIYNKYKTIFCCPVREEPFCRCVGEALFCGMHVMENGRVGAMQEIRRLGPEQFFKTCADAPKIFWEKVLNE
jgi:glycosyltransferase involved in cell wall biosynthesis